MRRIEQSIPICLLLFCFSLTGCQSLMSGSTGQQSTVQPPQGMVTIDVRPADRKRSTKEVAFQPNMRLQDVLQSTRAGFRKKNIYIVRESPTTGQKHKLEARFGANRKISFETDYALQPGDQVVIAEDTTSSVERAVRSMLGRS